MAPLSSLPLDRARSSIVPRYLTEADHPWLAALIEECERYVGRRRIELTERMKEPLVVAAPEDKRRLAAAVLERAYTDRTESAVAPVTIRRAVFGARAACSTRGAAIERAAAEVGVPTDDVEEHLFSDLPGQRRLVPLAPRRSAAELALETNHHLIVSLLRRATRVSITSEGDARALVRAVKLRGLLCTASPLQDGKAVCLDISGPYALFRHTLVYGRALGSLVSVAARSGRFELDATCALGRDGEVGQLIVRSGDPVVPAAVSRKYDGKVEERFAREFSRLCPDWDLVREPEAIPLADGWIFPDFLIRHRRRPEHRALLEIVGFWTPEYLKRKLAALRRARLEHLILCVDAARNCADDDFPEQARVIRYRRRVEPAAVLEAVEANIAGRVGGLPEVG